MSTQKPASRSSPARVLALAGAALLLSTCQDFFGTADLKQRIKDDVIDATAAVVTVNIAPPASPSMGAPSPVGTQSWKVGVSYTITTSVGDKYAFAGWTADSGDVSFADAASATTTFTVNAAFAGTITVTPNYDTRPKVIYVSPTGNDVPINKTITIKFSEDIDSATVDLGTSVLVTTWPTTNPEVDPVSIHAGLGLSVSGTVVTLSPSSFYEKYYTILVTLTPGITDLEGNPMADDYSWYFATTGTEDETAPAINSFTIRNAVGSSSVAASDRAYTNGTAIRLDVSATDDQYQVWKMQVIETPCDSSGFALGTAVDHGVVGFDGTYDFTLANSAEGWTKIQVRVADELDNWTILTNTAVDTKIIQMDTTQPTAPTSVSASPSHYYGGTYWYGTGSGVAFTPAGAGDGGSGLLGYSTSSDGSGYQSPSLTRGTGTYSIYTVDKAGNVSGTGFAVTVQQDAVGPDVPTITGSLKDYLDETTTPDTYWFKTVGVTFDLSSSDDAGGSGLRGFTTNSDGSGTQASSLTIGSGTHTFYAVDNVGNVTAGSSVIVKQDNTAPDRPTAAPPGGTYQDGDGVYWTTAAAGITFTLSGSDNAGGSGLDQYLIDGTSYPSSTTSILLAPRADAHTIYAVDKVGLQSVVRGVTVKQDSEDPSVTGDPLTATATTVSGFTTSDPVPGSGLDTGSYAVTLHGTATLAGSFDGSEMTISSGAPAAESHTDYDIHVEDNAGNGTTVTVRLSRDDSDNYTAEIL